MMVDQLGISGGGNFPVQSPSDLENSWLPVTDAAANYQPYPPPSNTYEDVVGSRDLFIETLKKLHCAMGTKFKVPIVGGKKLDLYQLFVQVTSRGGIAKVMKERKWKDVITVFSFPSSATNASFIFRKYYISLLYHYEQIYFFKAKCWTPMSSVSENVLSVSQKINADLPQNKPNTAIPEVSLASPATGSPISGVIDGKFESGYLITVKIGSEDFKGVLYHQVPNHEPQIFPSNQTRGPVDVIINNHNDDTSTKQGLPRRKRRKKSEIRKRDPAHPKPNRSGYNFFFAEQHAKLKPLYRGRDREISRIIGDSWNKSQEPERAVYQEKALRDKERYKVEMEDYRERLKNGQLIGNAVPIKQYPIVPNLLNFDMNFQFVDAGPSAHTEKENEMSNDEKSDIEGDASTEKDKDFGENSQAYTTEKCEYRDISR